MAQKYAYICDVSYTHVILLVSCSEYLRDKPFLLTMVSYLKDELKWPLFYNVRCNFMLHRSVGMFTGELITKCLFDVFKFFQKTNENKSTWGILVVKLNFFVPFLEELRIPKSPFEINWPLMLYKMCSLYSCVHTLCLCVCVCVDGTSRSKWWSE